MRTIRRLKDFFLVYALIQFAFMILYTPITGHYDLFPLFTWNIFRPYPAKYQDRFEMFFTNINGKEMPPTRMTDLERPYFSHINHYDFSDKVDKAGVAIINRDEDTQNRLLGQIEDSLLEGNVQVSFIIRQMWFEPIAFLKKGQVESERVILEKNIPAERSTKQKAAQ